MPAPATIQGLQLGPKNAFAVGNRGLAYAKKGDYYRAISDFNEAIRLNPNAVALFAIEELQN